MRLRVWNLHDKILHERHQAFTVGTSPILWRSSEALLLRKLNRFRLGIILSPEIDSVFGEFSLPDFAKPPGFLPKFELRWDGVNYLNRSAEIRLTHFQIFNFNIKHFPASVCMPASFRMKSVCSSAIFPTLSWGGLIITKRLDFPPTSTFSLENSDGLISAQGNTIPHSIPNGICPC